MNSYGFTISLRVFHPTAHSSEIALALELAPKFAKNVGETRATPRGNKLEGVNPETYCSFQLEEQTNGNIEEYIESWCEKLKKKKEFFSRVKKDGGRVEFFIGLFLSGNSGINFSAETFDVMANLGLDMALDLYN